MEPHNVANKQKGLIQKYAGVNLKDADSLIIYASDSDSFDGNVVGSTQYDVLFGDYIQQPTIYNSSHPTEINDFIFVNGVEINKLDYRGDYGKNFSVIGQDWCFETRFKAVISNESHHYCELSTREMKITLDPIISNVNYHDSVLDVYLYFGEDEAAFLWWSNIPISTTEFSFIRLACVGGKYELHVNGVLAPIYSFLYPSIYFSYGAATRGSAYIGNTNNYPQIKLEVDADLPSYQLFGVPVIYDKTFKSTSVIYTPEKLAELEADSNFVKIISIKNYKIYRSKKPLSTVPTGRISDISHILDDDYYFTHDIPYAFLRNKLYTHNNAEELETVFGLKSIVVGSHYIDVFFNTSVIIEPSIRIELPTPVEVWLDIDLFMCSGNTFPLEEQYKYFKNNLWSGQTIGGTFYAPTGLKIIVKVINGLVNVTIDTGGGTNIDLSPVLITYVNGIDAAKNFKFRTPLLETINDAKSFEIKSSDLYCYFSELYAESDSLSYTRFFTNYDENYARYKITQGIHTLKANNLIVADVVNNDGSITQGDNLAETYNYSYNPEITDRNNYDFLGDISVLNYFYREEIGTKPSYCFGIDRFNVTEDSIEIIFDDTFVEDSYRIDTPFKLSFKQVAGDITKNYDVIVSMINNTFMIELTKLIYPNANNGNFTPVKDGDPFIYEFTATVRQWDLKVYDSNFTHVNGNTTSNSSVLKINGYNLDEMRFTVGTARLDAKDIVPAAPFPDFVAGYNKIKFDSQATFTKTNLISNFEMSVVGKSGMGIESNYNTFDADFDKVQLLLHFNDANGEKQVSDVKGHYPVGLKETNVLHGAFGVQRESVIALSGEDFSGIEISPNNKENRLSSFNLFQDIDGLTRSSSIDWCFEFFINDIGGNAFTTGGYVASNSYTPNIENDFTSGVDWGIKLADSKIIAVIGNVEYPFYIPIDYLFSVWDYIRVYRHNNTLGCWLGERFLGAYESVISHEKQHKNYFRIGRANTKESLRALLDEVRFTIGTARISTAGKIPHRAFPNIGDLSQRPRINLIANAEISASPAPIPNVEINGLVKVVAASKMGVSLNEIPLIIPAPEISLDVALPIRFDVLIDMPQPVFNLSFGGYSTDIALAIPQPNVFISIGEQKRMVIAGELPAPLVTLNIGEAKTISFVVVLPDIQTLLSPIPKVSIPVSLPAPSIGLSIAANTGVSIDIQINVVAPSIELSILNIYANEAMDIALMLPAPQFNFEIGGVISFDVKLKQPDINLFINAPEFGRFDDFWNELLTNYSSGLYFHIDNTIPLTLPSPSINLSVGKNYSLSIDVKLPRPTISLSISHDNSSQSALTIPILLPAPVIDMSNCVMNIALMMRQPTIHIQLLAPSAFL